MATLSNSKRIVVKIGSALLVDQATGALRQSWLDALIDDVSALRANGADVVLVSSGSIALGRGVLGLPAGELALEQAQAAASVGQIRLAHAYDNALVRHGLNAGQVLVTLEDSTDRRRYLNARATLMQLLGHGVVPIVNENDTVATDEIRYGDNDRLAAQVAVTIGADCLVLLSDVDGLYTANPREDATARRFDVIDQITPEIEAMAGDAGTGLSKGGMKTKVMAAKTATAGGCAMVIALGIPDNALSYIDKNASVTWFTPALDPQTARKRWIASMKPKGAVQLDAGAVKALQNGKSLLPAGVTIISGRFERGDPVEVQDQNGNPIAQGLVRYSSQEANQIKGQRSENIADILGYTGRAALIHRDDLAN